MIKKVVVGIVVLLFVGCGLPKEEVDLIVHNAQVYTVDSLFSKQEAFAIKDGRFVAIASSKEIKKKYKAPTVINVKKQTIVPGLIDGHCHFYGLGLNKQVVDLVGTTSFEEILERIAVYAAENENVSIIQGRGWDQNDWAKKEFPTKKELDTAYPDIPVVLKRIDGHAYLVNQKALDMAGINKGTKVSGGEIEIINRRLTGILIDNPMALVQAILPAPTKEMKIKGLLEAQKICFKYGLTTVNDAGLNKSTIELIDSLQQTGDLDIRVYAMVSNSKENLDYYLPKGIVKTPRLTVRSVKVYADGALGSRGAALKESYSDKDNHFGAMVTPVTEIKTLAERIVVSGYQMNTHAIGDAANSAVLKAYKIALEGKKDQRWKVEHAQVISPQDLAFFSPNILASVQPTHATSDMYWAEERLGKKRLKGAYAYKTLLEKAGLIVLGTDFPVEHVNPFLTFYAAVARKDVAQYPENGFRIEEALSREEALKGMTIWPAYSNFEEKEKGSIEVGKWADFVILDKNIMEAALIDIPKITVKKTFVAGKQVKPLKKD